MKNAKTLGFALAIVGAMGIVVYIWTLIRYFAEIENISEKLTNEFSDKLTSTEDLSLGLLLTIECAASIIVLGGGLLGFYGSDDKNNLVEPMFFLSMLAFIAFAATGVYRSVTIYGANKGQCEYFGGDGDGVYGDLTNACPTTRHALMGISGKTSDIKWEMEKTEPTAESDCVFWFWDATPPLRVMMASSTDAYRDTVMIRAMDWTQKHPYGWYDAEDGRTAYKTLESDEKLNVEIVEKLPTSVSKPNISHCYYWGCSKVCNGDRFLINRLLLWASLSMTAIMLFITIYAGYSWNKKPEKVKNSKAAMVVLNPGGYVGEKPLLLHRKRTLRF